MPMTFTRQDFKRFPTQRSRESGLFWTPWPNHSRGQETWHRRVLSIFRCFKNSTRTVFSSSSGKISRPGVLLELADNGSSYENAFGNFARDIFSSALSRCIRQNQDRLPRPRCAIYPASFGRAARLL